MRRLIMFWTETLKEGQCYCTCFASWKSIRFSYLQIDEPTLKIYMTPDDGRRCLVYNIIRGSYNSILSKLQHQFNSWQHVRIEVIGGEITLIGTVDDDDQKQKYAAGDRYIQQCPFGTEEEWRSEKYDSIDLVETNFTPNEFAEHAEPQTNYLNGGKEEIGSDLNQPGRTLNEFAGYVEREANYLIEGTRRVADNLNSPKPTPNDLTAHVSEEGDPLNEETKQALEMKLKKFLTQIQYPYFWDAYTSLSSLNQNKVLKLQNILTDEEFQNFCVEYARLSSANIFTDEEFQNFCLKYIRLSSSEKS